MITVRGVAGPVVRAALADLRLTPVGDNTVLEGVLPDQAALHGVLRRIEKLGLEIVNLQRKPEPWP